MINVLNVMNVIYLINVLNVIYLINVLNVINVIYVVDVVSEMLWNYEITICINIIWMSYKCNKNSGIIVVGMSYVV